MNFPMAVGSSKISRRPTIGDQIREAQAFSENAWKLAVRASEDYRRALNMTRKEIDDLEHLGGYLAVQLPDGREVYLIPKQTCGRPYGDTWISLLQARLPDGSLRGIGQGTTFIATLSMEAHQQVLGAISIGNVKVRRGHVWP